jgi:hypothetical protein
VEIKTQNLSKMSKEQLYHFLVQKEISETDREKVKNELVKREAAELFTQAQRTRKGNPTPAAPGKTTGGQSGSKIQRISPSVWIFLLILAVSVGAVVFTALFR